VQSAERDPLTPGTSTGGSFPGSGTIRPLVACLLGCASQAAWSAPTFESCKAGVAARPAEYEPYRCYFEVATTNGEWVNAGKHLERLAAEYPHIDWIVFMRAAVTAPTDSKAAEQLYLEAARRFEAAGNVRGEVLARANLQSMFYQSGRIASAAQQVERVTALASRAEEAEISMRARLTEATFYIATGTHLGRAQRALQQAEEDLEAVPTYWLRRVVLQNSGNVLLLLGQYDQAVVYFRRLQSEAQAQRDIDSEARARLSIVNALVEKRSEHPQAVHAAQLFADADEALAAARRGQDVDLELSALSLLGEALMVDQPQRARGYIDACVERAQAAKRSQVLSDCLWIRGRLLADTDPAGAQKAIDAAINLLHYEEGADHGSLAYAWRHAMRVAWQIQTPDVAIATGKQALLAIERLRVIQDEQSRAAAFSAWTQDYYWLSARILRLSIADRKTDLVGEAFQIGEQMRARSLLDVLRASPRPLTDLDEAAIRHRENLLKEIVDVNRELLRAKESARTSLLSRLEALERQELELRQVRDRPVVAASPVSLTEVQGSLAANEAMLAFQTGPDGSWLFAVTRQTARVLELPGRHALSDSLALFKGLMRQSAGNRERAAIALYDRLLKGALEGLPAEVERLIVVPDLPLDTFPLTALSSSRSAQSLARKYEVVLVPSATIWHEWRTHPARAQGRATLVLADPQLEFATTAASERPLGPLPHARAEGREILVQLDRHGTLWTGSEASETAFKALDLSRYGVLHFAAHTVIDSANTDRSAILLASGTGHEDGLLQGREIAELTLDRQLVVLSACQSATGTQVRGEGVLGLARSFFAAGARTVIGSLWPIRDDHAQAFFDAFYASLAQGRAVGGAFHQAQQSLIDDGLPAEAWAGFVLMGDPDAAPVTAIPDRSTRWIIAAAILLLLICAIAASRRVFRKGSADRQATAPRPARAMTLRI
jgi:CHAT domain-containing protein